MNEKTNYISLYEFMDNKYYTIDMINNINAISSLKIGDKLYFKDNFIFIDNRKFMPIMRTLDGSGRDQTINKLEDFYETIFTKIKKFRESFELKSEVFVNDYPRFKSTSNVDDIMIRNLTKYIKQSLNGIYNLKITYLNDYEIIDKLNNIIRKINNILDTTD